MKTVNAFVSHPFLPNEAVVTARNICVGFNDKAILDGLDLDIYRGEILGFIGPSGAGKSVLMRTILGLNQKQGGVIKVFGQDLDKISLQRRNVIDMRVGVLFQRGALFSSLTVLENIQVMMREYLDLSPKLLEELAYLKLALVGLASDSALKRPAELSGGMVKRAALARALALDPAIVFLDEPTSGLDPVGAAEFDALIKDLRDTLGLTVYMVTHDLGSICSVCDRIAILGDKRVKYQGTLGTILQIEDPWIQSYFKRAKLGSEARNIQSSSPE
ncbi:ABC transporter ATP-binding protein [Bartonella sp. DGB2]|uniref:ABC transporter ATP-binding protein n=1 Tax=Bartonella sp. DGB2 TaxID=3388426 RepID=UPI00398FEBDF